MRLVIDPPGTGYPIDPPGGDKLVDPPGGNSQGK